MKVWLNDRLTEAEAACIAPTDRGFLLADGLFETLRVQHGRPRHLAAHLRRLAEGCAVLKLPMPSDIPTAITALLLANQMEHGSVRLTWTRGSGPRGVLPSGQEKPTLLITATPAAPQAASPSPWALVTCRGTLRNEHSPLARIKSLNYGDGLLARLEAAEAGANDAILLNTAGRVAETSIANLFLCRDGVWLTPPVREGALPGIRRGEILSRGLASESQISEDDLAHAEAMVLTSSLMIQPVGQLNGRPLPNVAAAEDWAAHFLSKEQ